MSHLFKFSVVSYSKILSARTAVCSARFLSNNKNTGGRKLTPEEEEIELIKKHEESYFGNVKKSFDNLQKNRLNESVEEKRSRLMYQSRKRGTLENGLLLSHFSAEYLPNMSENQLNEYDKIINSLHNEWDLYYWLTGAIPVPDELKSSEVLKMMKVYSANQSQQSRIVQPDLKFKN